MTAQCGGGTSSIKPGAPLLVNVGVGLITAGIAESAPFLLPIAILLDSFVWNAQVNCSADPPPAPSFSPDDMQILATGLLTPNVGTILQKVQDVVTRFLWSQECQCDGGITPTPIAPATRTDTSGGGSASSVTPCFAGGWSGIPPVSGTLTRNQWPDITSAIVPITDNTTRALVSHGLTYNAHPIPSGLTSIKWVGHTSISANYPAVKLIPGVQFEFWDTSGNSTDSFNFQTSNNVNQAEQAERSLTTTVAYAWVGAGYGTPTPPDSTTDRTVIDAQVFCGGQQSTSIESCCPPDDSIAFALNQVLQLSQQILAKLAPPSTSWANGIVHTALSGTGSFQLAKNVTGIRATFTTIPPNIRVTPGTPTFYWDLGFVTPTAATYPLRSLRSVFATQDMLLPAQADGVDYTFPPGVVVTLTELLPA